MRLTPEQQRVVEENMGLVVKVIQDKVHDLNQDSCFSFEDLRQIGAIGLCKAAATDREAPFLDFCLYNTFKLVESKEVTG